MSELNKIMNAISMTSGEEFFKTLSHYVCQKVDAVCMHVALFAKNDYQTMVTIFCDGVAEVDTPLMYFTADTFCRSMIEDGVFLCHDNAADNYPEDYLLNHLRMSSCVAVPLYKDCNELCGTFSLMAYKPFKDSELTQKLLNNFAPRVANEALRKQVEAELKYELWLSRAALDAIPTPIFFKDKEGSFSGWNRAFADFCGLTSYGAELAGSLGIYDEEDRKLLHEGGNLIVETFVMRADGKQRNVLLHKAGFVKNNGQTHSGLVGTMIDVTELRTAEKKANYLAHYDRLTELPNLVLFQDRLNTEIIHARRHDERLAVFAIDIDHFKKVNNVYGHDLGDSLLKVVARRITETIREEDTAARFGGDSFTLLLRNIRYEEDAAIIAKKIHESVSQPFFLDDQEVFISVSIGIALYPLDGDDVQTLIKNSDVALHRAKERGRSNHLFFAPEMNFRASEQMKLQNSLRRALDRDEFIIHYQPQYDAESGRMIGVEALLRWQHPELGMVYPDQFIPLAEHIGLIVPIGEWVLRTACQDARAWNEENQNPIRVAVNLSPRQFQQPDLYEKICQIINETGVEPAWLGLEITESAVMQNVDYAVCVLTDLKKLGVHLSVDDFGTGYSSLSYLKKFPIDLLKIDRSFITDIPKDSDDIAIVSAVVSMAHNLNLKVLAEGVETLEQKDFLHSVSCDEFQGFYFSRPVAAHHILQ